MALLENKWIAIVLIIVLAFAIYGPTIGYDFVLDDKIVLTENEYTKQGLKGIPKLFSADSFTGYFGEQKDLLPGARYRPLSLVTFALETELFGVNSKIHHLGNILLYIICCVSIYFAMLSIFRNQFSATLPFIALGTAILFLVHPIHVEAVANIKGRDEIMALLLSILSLKWAHDYFKSGKWTFLIGIGVAFILALFSKENALTFLGVIPFSLFLYSKANRSKWMWIGISLLLPMILYFLIRYNAVGYILNTVEATNLMNNPFINMSDGQRYATVFHTLLLYLKLGFFPHPLTHDYYPFHIPTKNWSDITPIISLLVYSVMGVFSFLLYRKKKIVAWSFFFFIATISIISNLVVNVGTFMNERFLFMPSLGLIVFLVFLIDTLKTSSRPLIRYAGIALFAIIFIAYTAKSIIRVPDWKNTLTLNQSAIKVSKNSARANLFMGTAYFTEYQQSQNESEKTNLLGLAEQYVGRSFELYPKYGNANHMVAGIAAEKYRADRDLNKLLLTFSQVVKQRPDTPFLHTYFEYLNGAAANSQLVNFYYDMGYNELFRRQNKADWAAKYLQYAYQLNGNSRNINMALSEVYQSLNRPQEAQFYMNKASSAQ